MNIKALAKRKSFRNAITLKLPYAVDSMNDEQILANFPLNKVDEKGYFQLVCFNYALRKKYLYSLEDSFNFVLYNYNPVALRNARRGDIVTFHKIERQTRGLHIPNENTIEHFAIISNIDIEKNIFNIRSKWGSCGIFEGRIDDLPKFYGNEIVIWRRKNKISPTTKTECVKNTIG